MVFFVMGCASPAPPAPEAPSTGKAAPDSRTTTVRTRAGTADHFGPGDERPKLWSLSWQDARLDVADDGIDQARIDLGDLRRVRATLYQDARPIADLTAQEGRADPKTETLRAGGSVKIVGRDDNIVLTAASVEYLRPAGVVKAKGDVIVRTPSATIGPMPELWATPDLREVANPSLFRGGRL
jgi:hypothetical protein